MRWVIARFPFDLTKSGVLESMKGTGPSRSGHAVAGDSAAGPGARARSRALPAAASLARGKGTEHAGGPRRLDAGRKCSASAIEVTGEGNGPRSPRMSRNWTRSVYAEPSRTAAS
ncbi:hypothetical protein ACWD62_41020 [Streptomyces sp. NPDC005146]